eukprot:Gb_22069 [translate_table: standard]
MSLACLACHGVGSSTDSFRSYSTSSDSDSEVRCGARASCCLKKTSAVTANRTMTSKVAPQPAVTPRLLRCPALRRDIFRDWHFEEIPVEGRQLRR